MKASSQTSGANLFARDPADDPRGHGFTDLAYQFIAGVLRHGPALCAAFAPTVNSYKRLVRRGLMAYYSWAPVFNSYGRNNRTNALRVPVVGGRVESRNADAACNRYLAAAGIEELPRTLDEAVRAFAADPLVIRTFGQEFRDEFIVGKSEEWRQYHQTISQWEIDRYARVF